jgi:dTDP-4-dehydrorhamnose reductase
MRALVIGAGGQVGRALIASASAGTDVTGLTSAELDVTDAHSVARIIRAIEPDVILNAAAYTAVDEAEAHPERALAANGSAVGYLAAAAQDARAILIHISTDFVFDGRRGSPYRTDELAAPLSAYGRSKLAGERLAGKDALVVRTGWIYSAEGRNFVLTMLRLMRERDELRVVADQIGTPTWAASLADALWRLAALGARGTLDFSDSGVASWDDFAVAIEEEAHAVGLLERPVRLIPFATGDYPTPALRPAYSVLDKSEAVSLLGEAPPHWRVNLRRMLGDLVRSQDARGAPIASPLG